MENIPAEILIHIFEYLDVNSMIMAMEVSVRWNQIIKDLLTSNFMLIICPCNIQTVLKLVEKFNFKKIRILPMPSFNKEKYCEKIIKIVLKNSNYIKELLIDGIYEKTVIKILKMCAGLKHLQVHNIVEAETQKTLRRTRGRKFYDCKLKNEHKKYLNLFLKLTKIDGSLDENMDVDSGILSIENSRGKITENSGQTRNNFSQYIDNKNENFLNFEVNDQNKYLESCLGAFQYPHNPSFYIPDDQPQEINQNSSTIDQIWNDLQPDLFDIAVQPLDFSNQNFVSKPANELQRSDSKNDEIQEIFDMLMEIDDEQQTSSSNIQDQCNLNLDLNMQNSNNSGNINIADQFVNNSNMSNFNDHKHGGSQEGLSSIIELSCSRRGSHVVLGGEDPPDYAHVHYYAASTTIDCVTNINCQNLNNPGQHFNFQNESIQVPDDSLYDNLLIYLLLLKSLNIKNFGNIFDDIPAPNLTSLNITIHNSSINLSSATDPLEFTKTIEKSSNFAKIQKFMETMKSLKVLTLNELNLSCIIDCTALPFQLEKLTITTYGSRAYNSKFSFDQRINFNSSILMFLNQQIDSLKEVEIDSKFLKMTPNQIFTFLLTSKLMKFSINCFQDKNNFIEFKYDKLNNELKYSGKLYEAEFQFMIQNFPNITNLSLNVNALLNIDVLQMIRNSMPNLTFLSISPFFKNISKNVIFENLQKLEIKTLYEKCGTVNWDEIVLTCPNIKELSLYDDYFKINSGRLARIIRKSKKLEIVKKFCKIKFSVDLSFYEFFLRPSMANLEMTIFANITLEKFNQLTKCILTDPNICVSYKMINNHDKHSKSLIKFFKIVRKNI